MNLDPAALKFQVREALREAKAELLRDHHLEPRTRIIHHDGFVERAKLDGRWMDDGRLKGILFEFMGEYCRKKDASGVVFISDAWTLEHSPEQLKRMFEDKARLAEFERITKEQGVPEAAQQGYGRLWETVQVQGQTRDFAWGMLQWYDRIGKDGPIPATAVRAGTGLPAHTIRFAGKPRVMSSDRGNPSGRMFTFYEGKGQSDDDASDIRAAG